jgi:hypothetical protein
MTTTDTRETDPYITFPEAAKLAVIGAGNLPPHLNTLRRWAQVGLCGIRLRARVRGSRWYTTASAVREFLAAVEAERMATLLAAEGCEITTGA